MYDAVNGIDAPDKSIGESQTEPASIYRQIIPVILGTPENSK